MSFDQLQRMEQVVILHSGGLDPGVLVKAAGIEPPVSITSFTNGGKHTEEILKLSASTSDHLLIEQSLWRMTEDSLTAERAQAIMSHPHTLRVFENGVVTAIVSAAGYDRRLLQLEITVGTEVVE